MLSERRQQQEKEENEIVGTDITVLSMYDKKKMKRNPVNNTFNLIGRAFTVMILYTMMNSENMRFNRLLESIDGIGPKTFSKRLREMDQNGLI
ncbi:MAG: winged helix-turn-helix transcriptional regulator, partial [Candidatus Nitrosopolaris sp.]